MIGGDLSSEALAELMPGRPTRSYPALLSTGADALAWARTGGPEGALVVADYQASARGRAGTEWTVRRGVSVCFSLILRPDLPVEREGWLYTVVVSGLADALGPEATIEWPDGVVRADVRLGAVGVHAELGPDGVDWAVANVLVPDVPPPRGPTLARIVRAIELRYRSPDDLVLDEYLPRCATIGRQVRARLIPVGPAGVVVAGTATGAKLDGALSIETGSGFLVAVRPQHLGVIEDMRSGSDELDGFTDYREMFPSDG